MQQNIEMTPCAHASRVQAVDAAIMSRQSVRAFLDVPVAREVLEDILDVAARAASGANRQPWKVYVLQGRSRDELTRKVCAAHDALRDDPSLGDTYHEGYDYYPKQWFSPYLERRRENGWGLYGLLGIAKGEKNRMHAQHQRNFRFFDAPVGLMLTVDKRLMPGALLDYGGFMQNLMVAAQARGLASCAQAAWNTFQDIVLEHVGASGDELLVTGMALGHPDPAALVNTYRTPRVPAQAFAAWLD